MTGATQFWISQNTPEYPAGQSQPQLWFTVPPFWQVIDVTVTLNEHEDDPHEFVAVQVTGVVPEANVEPETGEQTTVAAGVAVAVGSVQVAMFVLQRSISEGQEAITGVSLIVTLNEQLELPHELDAVHVTVVVPVAKEVPLSGEQTTVAAGLAVAVGSVQVATWLSH